MMTSVEEGAASSRRSLSTERASVTADDTDVNTRCSQQADQMESKGCGELTRAGEGLSEASETSDGVALDTNAPLSATAQDSLTSHVVHDAEHTRSTPRARNVREENESSHVNSLHISNVSKKPSKRRLVSLGNLLKCAPIPEGLNSPRSLRLCDKYNINPKELVPRKVNDFTQNGVPANLAEMRFHSYRNRLYAHLAILAPEYTKLVESEAVNAESDNTPTTNTVNEGQDSVIRPWQIPHMKERASTMNNNNNRRGSLQNRSSVFVSPNRGTSPQRSEHGNDKSRSSIYDERRASVLERYRLLQEMQHMELVRRRLEKEKQAYQRVRDLADEREIFMEMHHLQNDHPQLRQFKQLKSVAHLAAQYSRNMYRSPKRALDTEVLDQVVEHLFITS